MQKTRPGANSSRYLDAAIPITWARGCRTDFSTLNDCKSACPRCGGKLMRYEGKQMAPNPAEMFTCTVCRRWWRHVRRDAGCGLVGTIKTVGTEVFTPCRSEQGELFQ